MYVYVQALQECHVFLLIWQEDDMEVGVCDDQEDLDNSSSVRTKVARAKTSSKKKKKSKKKVHH